MNKPIFKGKRIDTNEEVQGFYFKTPLTDENSGAAPESGWFFLSDGVERHCIANEHGTVFTVHKESVETIKTK